MVGLFSRYTYVSIVGIGFTKKVMLGNGMLILRYQQLVMDMIGVFVIQLHAGVDRIDAFVWLRHALPATIIDVQGTHAIGKQKK